MKKITQMLTMLAVSGLATAAMAAEGGGAGYNIGLAYAAAAAIAIAAFGGAFSQSMAIKSALDSIGRNPSAAGKITTPMIIGLAMIESLVIYALVIALMLVLKI
ncbi:MAG: ATP synthase F0 subunit C [Pseudomonadota bacterium]|nr:ATP synthase F0 subunit C [Pseudomonadota bacterium]